jgi:hypothetical protein
MNPEGAGASLCPPSGQWLPELPGQTQGLPLRGQVLHFLDNGIGNL